MKFETIARSGCVAKAVYESLGVWPRHYTVLWSCGLGSNCCSSSSEVANDPLIKTKKSENPNVAVPQAAINLKTPKF